VAEFCLECWNKLNDDNLTKKDVVISKGLDLCEGCGKFKQVIICYKKRKEKHKKSEN